MAYIEKIDIDTATQEVERFLDARKLRPKVLESFSSLIPHLIEAVQFGFLVFGKDAIKMILEEPIGDGGSIKEIELKYRVAPGDLRASISRLKSQKFEEQLKCVFCEYCVTPGMVPAIIDKLEPNDFRIFNAFALIFFP